MCRRFDSARKHQFNADLAHLVERHLAKVEVASSSLVIRSNRIGEIFSVCKKPWSKALRGFYFCWEAKNGRLWRQCCVRFQQDANRMNARWQSVQNNCQIQQILLHKKVLTNPKKYDIIIKLSDERATKSPKNWQKEHIERGIEKVFHGAKRERASERKDSRRKGLKRRSPPVGSEA